VCGGMAIGTEVARPLKAAHGFVMGLLLGDWCKRRRP